MQLVVNPVIGVSIAWLEQPERSVSVGVSVQMRVANVVWRVLTSDLVRGLRTVSALGDGGNVMAVMPP